MIRLLALVLKAPDISPNQRFRHEQWAPHLARDHGIHLEFEPFESPALTELLYRDGYLLQKARLVFADALRRWRARYRALEFDGIVVLRQAMLVGGPWVERSLTRRRVPLFYDFDDAIWIWQPSARNGILNLASAPWKVGAICRLATVVTVGSAYLAAYARRHNPNVHIVRTSIDIDRYPEYPDPGVDRPFTIVWTGSHSTLAHLETIRSPLERLAVRQPVTLRVVCDTPPPPFGRVDLEFVRWRAATEAQDLAPGHVGVMPLPDTPATRGKCGCKALQYMAIGRPVVVSPVGFNREIVQDGVSGLWANFHGDWEAQLARLADDPALRMRLGAAGRRTVLEGFTARASAAAFAAAVNPALPRTTASPTAR